MADVAPAFLAMSINRFHIRRGTCRLRRTCYAPFSSGFGRKGTSFEASPQVFLLVAPSLIPSLKLDGLIRSASGVSLTV